MHHWSVETMLAGLFGDLYHDDGPVKKLIEVPHFVANVHAMFEASTRLQMVSSVDAANNNTPDWVKFKTAADEVRIICSRTKHRIFCPSTGEPSFMQSRVRKIAEYRYRNVPFCFSAVRRSRFWQKNPLLIKHKYYSIVGPEKSL